MSLEAQLLTTGSTKTKASFSVALTERGSMLTSADFFKMIEKWQLNYPSIDFFLGGPDGLCPSLIDHSNFSLSLSAMTLPHALARLVLVEQLYRALTYLNNHPYHRS